MPAIGMLTLLGWPSRSKRTGSAAGKAWSHACGCGGGAAAEATPPAGAVCVQGHPRGRRPRTAADLHVFVWWLGGVGDPAQSILETGVQIDEQGLGVRI